MRPCCRHRLPHPKRDVRGRPRLDGGRPAARGGRLAPPPRYQRSGDPRPRPAPGRSGPPDLRPSPSGRPFLSRRATARDPTACVSGRRSLKRPPRPGLAPSGPLLRASQGFREAAWRKLEAWGVQRALRSTARHSVQSSARAADCRRAHGGGRGAVAESSPLDWTLNAATRRRVGAQTPQTGPGGARRGPSRHSWQAKPSRALPASKLLHVAGPSGWTPTCLRADSAAGRAAGYRTSLRAGGRRGRRQAARLGRQGVLRVWAPARPYPVDRYRGS